MDFLEKNIMWVMAGLGVLGLGAFLLTRSKTISGSIPFLPGTTDAQKQLIYQIMGYKTAMLENANNPQSQIFQQANNALLQVRAAAGPEFGVLCNLTRVDNGQSYGQLLVINSVGY